MKYIVVDIGCIECGEPSHMVGVYSTREEAVEAVGDEDGEDERSYFDKGQHHVQIFEWEGA